MLDLEELYCPCSKNKGIDQLPSYYEADLHLYFGNMQNVGFLTMWFILWFQMIEYIYIIFVHFAVVSIYIYFNSMLAS